MCPQGIRPQQHFKAYNRAKVWGLYEAAKEDYLADGLDKDAEKCLGCGACSAECPQFIGIPEKLAEIKCFSSLPHIETDIENKEWALLKIIPFSILGLEKAPKPDDTADALAIALCHHYQMTNPLAGVGGKSDWKKFLENNPGRIKK